MTKTFINLSSEECAEVYPSIIKNSDDHFNIAHILQENLHYGSAVSHLVLGSEELVKALIMFFDGIGLKLRQTDGVSRFFRNHKSRHYLSTIIQIISVFVITPVMEIATTYKSITLSKKNISKMNDFERALFGVDEKESELLISRWAKKLAESSKPLIDFWDEADYFKQQGFYVDYENRLIAPTQIKKADYIIALKATSRFREDCKKLINYFVNLTLKEKNAFISFANSNERFKKTIDDLFSESLRQIKRR